jgi:hypothetical protein
MFARKTKGTVPTSESNRRTDLRLDKKRESHRSTKDSAAGKLPSSRQHGGAVPSRTCQVSFTDSDGIEPSVRVPAESLYEAAVEAIAAFRRSVLAEMPLGPGTRPTIRVMAPEEEHTVTIGKVLAWLDGVAISPSEKLKKKRLKERLRIEVVRRGCGIPTRQAAPDPAHGERRQAPESGCHLHLGILVKRSVLLEESCSRLACLGFRCVRRR